MSAPPAKRALLVCRNKRRFTDEIHARAVGMDAVQNSADVKRLWIYKCHECKGFHLTSKNKARRMMVTADEPFYAPADSAHHQQKLTAPQFGGAAVRSKT